jgi:hypothetical protein
MARFGSSANPGKPGDEPNLSTYYRGQRYDQRTQPRDPGNEPTRRPDSGGPEPRPPQDPGVAQRPPTPWFRRRWVLITWIALVVLMIALVIWGIIELISSGPEESTVPSSTPSTTTTSTTSTTGTTPTTTTRGASTPAAPPPAGPPSEAPAPGGHANEPPHHRHRLPPLPSVVTIPPLPKAPEVPTVITLPPGL